MSEKHTAAATFGRSEGAGAMDEYQQELAHVAFLLANLEVREAWWAYVEYGGNQDLLNVDAFLNGLIPLPARDCNLLALILNERLTDLQVPHLATYSN